MDVICTTASLKVKDLFEMLYFFLKLLYVRIIRCAHFISLYFYHDLFSTIGKLEGRDRLFDVIDNR